ncbi:MAG TPA: carboxypeptidase-like regulatory domain-containing protein [Gemmatimonadaceae bacterium]|nr:carboxypeptidase-like regulatory domain-containing protein [Gemmatimonadaceae bacterium]
MMRGSTAILDSLQRVVTAMRRPLLTMLLAMSCALNARGQDVREEVHIEIQASHGIAVSGALVALVDATGATVAEGISRENGTRSFRAPAGTYRIHVLRIGFRPFLSDSFSIPATRQKTVVVESARVQLSAVLVSAKSRCTRIDDDTQVLSLLWDEITKALRASQLTTSDLSGVTHSWIYRKEVNGRGLVLNADTTRIPITNQKPFGAPDAAALARDGYAQGDDVKGWTYSGPDETVLLSNEFQSTHCFRAIRDRSRPGQIAMAFEPVPGRQVADISGYVWVDQASSELREITFRFANAGLLSRFNAGGSTRFRRMPSGAWLVDKWHLRGPRLVREGAGSDRILAAGYFENGGGLLDGK